MPPKKKKKADSKKEKMLQVDRTFYELTIADLNQKIDRVTTHIISLSEGRSSAKEKLRSLEEDGIDEASQLSRALDECNLRIEHLNEEHLSLTRAREEDRRIATEKIANLEFKYKAMHDQLTAEVRLLTAKLNSLDEFRLKRDKLLSIFDDKTTALKERDREHEEDLLLMQQKAILETDTIKKEVEVKLLQVSEDFTRASEKRDAGYTRRLIRENIALQKEIADIALKQNKLQQAYNGQQFRYKEVAYKYTVLDRVRNELVLNALNKLNIIEGLTENFERLKKKYSRARKYRLAYQHMIDVEYCAFFEYQEASKDMAKVKKRVEILKQDKYHLHQIIIAHAQEIEKLRDTILKIRMIVQRVITASPHSYGQTESGTVNAMHALIRQQQRNLLSEIIDVIGDQPGAMASTSTVMTLTRSEIELFNPGKLGFLRSRKSSLLEVFKRPQSVHEDKPKSLKWLGPADGESFGDSMDRLSVESLIIDVEWGTPLIVSSSRDDEIIAAEEEPQEEPEGSSSSETIQVSDNSAPPAAMAAKASVSSKTQRESRVTATSPQAYALDEEAGEEEDEYEINLFY